MLAFTLVSVNHYTVLHQTDLYRTPCILQSARVLKLHCFTKPLPVINSTLDKYKSQSECKSKLYC